MVFDNELYAYWAAGCSAEFTAAQLRKSYPTMTYQMVEAEFQKLDEEAYAGDTGPDGGGGQWDWY